MLRAISSLLGLAALILCATSSVPAAAGEYYGGYDGYRSHRSGNVWYSSSCCYRKVVRHERSVRYVRTYGDGYYRAPSYRSSYYDAPRRYYGDRYDRGYVSAGYVNGGYDRCYSRRVRINDGYGGWVWSRTRVCD